MSILKRLRNLWYVSGINTESSEQADKVIKEILAFDKEQLPKPRMAQVVKMSNPKDKFLIKE